LLCLRTAAVHEQACRFLTETGFIGHILARIDPEADLILAVSGLALIASMAKRCSVAAAILVSNGVFNSFAHAFSASGFIPKNTDVRE
jgi:hypothetical protein